jgi:hypothetical protein
MADKMAGALRQFYSALRKEQDHIWVHPPKHEQDMVSRVARRTYELLKDTMTPIREKELSDSLSLSLPIEADFNSLGRFLYLPPLERNAEFVPVLSLKCYWSEERKDIRQRVMFYSFDEINEKLYGVGFRLESPHSDNQEEDQDQDDENEREEGTGRHDFYHAQLIRSLKTGLSAENPDWLPCKQPSFPLVANCPVTLTICLLLTLYGKVYCKQILRRLPIFQFINKYIQTLNPWINWGTF